MRDIDVLMFAEAVLSQEEMDAAFLAAFHKLPKEQQAIIEDMGLWLMTTTGMVKAEDSLEAIAKAGMYVKMHGPIAVYNWPRRKAALRP